MDPTQPPKPQRSPWLYIALGCLGLAVIICLAGGAFVLFVAKKGNDIAKGFTDPAVREENARKALGGIPEGYYVQGTLSMFGLMDMVALQDTPVLEDGGGTPPTRQFTYFRTMGTEENKKAREYFTKGDGADPASLKRAGVNVNVSELIKRGNLTVANRKVYFVAGRGSLDTGTKGGPAREGLETIVYFECPGDDLHMAVWAMPDPAPGTPAAELDLAGTVADEAALTKLVAPLNPCGS